MDDKASLIAREFISRYESAWNSGGVDAVAKLYAADGMLVGYAIASGRPDIRKLLGGIFAQGWTGIKIKIVNARRIGDVILVVNEYTAIGSGQNAGKILDAKASHVLVRAGGEWLSALHTAR
jgi:uncharacterized protein (TIGR02246 family)